MTMEGLILLVKMKFHGQFWRAGDGTQRQKIHKSCKSYNISSNLQQLLIFFNI